VLLSGLFLLLLAASPSLAGKVVLVGDDWPLSDYAFDVNDEQATLLAESLASFLSDGSPGSFLAASATSPVIPFGPRGVVGGELAQRMTDLGHSWLVDGDAEFTFANLSQYDAVYLCGQVGSGVENSLALKQYVLAGGSVLVMGGSADFGDAAAEAAAWAPFLGHFGLSLGDNWLGAFGGLIPWIPAVAGDPPPGQGIDTFAWSSGQLATVNDPLDPRTRVALRGDFSSFGGGPQGGVNDVVAVYEWPFLAGDFNDDGQVDAADYTVWRDALGTSTTLAGDSTPGSVDGPDFDAWRDNYGASVASGVSFIAVPEPTGVGLATLVAWAALVRARRGEAV
jgi:hypothetical protein